MIKIDEAKVEIAARELCRLRGRNPDAEIGHSPPPDENGIVYSMLVYSPAWKLVAAEIRDAIRLRAALAAAGIGDEVTPPTS